MDPTSFKGEVKQFDVKRSSAGANHALTYSYFFRPASADKPTVLFLHGFPSNAYECWRYQIAFFANKGYGVLAPDLLGYGGTSKPKEVEAYAKSLMAGDIVEILKEEKILNTQGEPPKVYAIGHDWYADFLSV